MSVAEVPTTTARVRQQYEYLPYPHRDPADEKKRLLLTGLDDLSCLNHYCYRGKKNIAAGMRILIAGGGTGDAVVYLAHQLRHTKCDIVYIDLSTASQTVARKRLAARGLENRVRWIHGSLLDLPEMNVGQFDYINCSGVLHHLESPETGLAALRAVMKDDGALGLMVYGQYGRTGIYQMQSLFRLINDPQADMGAQVAAVRQMIANLPVCNWYKRGAELFAQPARMSDSEVLDLFLHSQDRAYTVPQLYDFLASSGLHPAAWSSESRVWYQPQIAFRDPEVLARIQKLPRREQEAACEVFWGSITKHALWATPQPEAVAQWTDPDVVPTWTRSADLFNVRSAMLKTSNPEWCYSLEYSGGTKMQLRITLDDHTRRQVELMDGFRTVESIQGELATAFASKTAEQIQAECAEVFRLLNSNDLLVLRHKSVRPTTA
ncbi:methyltransferase [bacterium]|nr:methyltransferase [bacterium]